MPRAISNKKSPARSFSVLEQDGYRNTSNHGWRAIPETTIWQEPLTSRARWAINAAAQVCPGPMMNHETKTAEAIRVQEEAARSKNWKRWGPYLGERQWATVREDYSPDGTCWDYFPHEHARSRAYRWGEDGLLGITDRECRLCFALALWNGRDPIRKERLFGLTGPEGNHGEDVKA